MRTLSGRPAAATLFLASVGYLVFLVAALVWAHWSPEIVLGLTLGGIGVPLICLRPIVGVHLFVMTLYVESLFSENVLVMKAIGASILASWLLNVAVRRTTRLSLNLLIVAIALMVIWCGVTTIVARDAQEAISRTFQFAQLAVATLMFSSVLDTTAKIRSVYAAIVLWTCISTVIALVMYYVGMTPVASGLAHNRNALAMYIDFAIICSCVLYQVSESPAGKAIFLSIFPILFLGLALTLSRAGLIMLMLALLLVWFRLAREGRFFSVIGSTLAMVVLVSFLLPDAFWRRAGSIVPAIEHQEDTFGLRVKIWRVSLEIIKDHPIAGVGAGNFLMEFGRYAHGRFLWRHLSPHSSYVGMATETGLVGLGLFILVLLSGMGTARSAMRAGHLVGDSQVRLLAVVAEASIFAQIVGCFAGDGEVQKILWIMFGMALSLRRVGQDALARHPVSSSALRQQSAPVDGAAWGVVR